MYLELGSSEKVLKLDVRKGYFVIIYVGRHLWILQIDWVSIIHTFIRCFSRNIHILKIMTILIKLGCNLAKTPIMHIFEQPFMVLGLLGAPRGLRKDFGHGSKKGCLHVSRYKMLLEASWCLLEASCGPARRPDSYGNC